jgi:hypothetical protein
MIRSEPHQFGESILITVANPVSHSWEAADGVLISVA